MTIKGTFRIAGEITNVLIDGNNIIFMDSSGMINTINGIRLDYEGSIKENPDLKGDDDWKEKTIERFKKKVKSIEGDMEKIKYVKDELTKFGYDALYYQRNGHREKKFE